MTIIIDSMPEGYASIIQKVHALGSYVSPRGMPTYELMDVSIVLNDPRQSLPVRTGRKLHNAIGAAEALQLIGGVATPELMFRIAPNFKQFANGGVLAGAYGPRIRAQVPLVVDKLERDRDTRQALVTVFDPAYDHQAGINDVPCTVTLQWMIRGGKLDAFTHMRSNDVWWGLPYDVFQFTQLQIALASVLRVPVGRYFHHANSLHMYARDEEQALSVVPAEVELKDQPWAQGLGSGFDTAEGRLAEVRQVARDLLAGKPQQFNVAERWYTKTLAPYHQEEK